MSSRIEDILRATIDGAPYNELAQSRIEELLIELKEAIETGGGTPVDAYTKAQTDALLTEKADLSILTPMTQEEYDAIVTKTAPLYFIYEDGEGA